jgi:hypothetical protein
MYFEVQVGGNRLLPKGGISRPWNLAGVTSFPPLGPLLATAFDKSVGIMAARWMLMVAVVLASAIFGLFNAGLGYVPGEFFLIYWTYAVYANAARLENPSYGMGFGKVLTLLGIFIGVGILTELCLLLLIIPGIYVGNRYSMSPVAAVVDDVKMNDATKRSWALTENTFWPTLGFNVVVWLGMFAVIILGYVLFVGIAAGLMTRAEPGTILSGLPGAIVSVGFAVYVLAIGYAYQAHAVAQLYWYRALERATSLIPAPYPA